MSDETLNANAVPDGQGQPETTAATQPQPETPAPPEADPTKLGAPPENETPPVITEPIVTAPAPPKSKIVQVRFIDNGAPGTRQACEVAGRRFSATHWLYATVLEEFPELKALRVRVNHRGNLLHGTEMIVGPENYRTADDVQAELESAQKELQFRPRNDSKKRVAGFKAQLARFAKA